VREGKGGASGSPFVLLGSFLVLLTTFLTAPLVAAGVYASYADVRAVLTALAEILPAELKGRDQTALSKAWDDWALRHDREIRSRLERGDEDTVVNWLLFGTSFTSRPRAVFESSPTDAAQLVELVTARTRDLIVALQSPGSDERRLFARQLLERKGYRLQTPVDRDRLGQHLLAEVARVAGEQAGYARDLGDIRRLDDTTEQFVARSRLFRNRGLSADTTILPSLAIERSLAELRARGLIAVNSLHEVAVIGPGLDFSDKSSGYDFYPQQTLQPFTLMDSLVRLGLIDRTSPVHVATLDLSPRVNDHLTRARRRASRGLPYLIRLPIDAGLAWKPEVTTYWNAAGDRIGTAVSTPSQAPVGKNVRVRTMSIPPRVVLQIQPEDVNVVVQRVADRRFDLVIATNIFVYYDVLDQALAFANVEATLKPGGFLLSNNALLELPESRLRSVGYLTVQYSDRQDDGDHIVWYRRLPD
jgi:hypothetical protein